MTDPHAGKPPRTVWGEFPDVFIHAAESGVKQDPAYNAAKSGDDGAATDLVLRHLNVEQVHALHSLAQGRRPTMVSAHALEREGINAIPEVFAGELGRLLDWPVDAGVVQVNVVSHTGANGFSRLSRQAEFDGPIEPGREYVMVDDFVGMGGTLANLKGHIETNGGLVLAAVALTGKSHSAKLTPEHAILNELRLKHGTELEQWWIERFAHGLDALTQSEARYLARTETFDVIRNRIVEAEQTGNRPAVS